MNIEFRELFGPEIPLVPLKDAGNVVCANAARTDWNQVCKNDRVTEIYLIGNPPYLGAKLQDEEQKADLITAFQKYSYSKNLSISIWFIKKLLNTSEILNRNLRLYLRTRFARGNM